MSNESHAKQTKYLYNFSYWKFKSIEEITTQEISKMNKQTVIFFFFYNFLN